MARKIFENVVLSVCKRLLMNVFYLFKKLNIFLCHFFMLFCGFQSPIFGVCEDLKMVCHHTHRKWGQRDFGGGSTQ